MHQPVRRTARAALAAAAATAVTATTAALPSTSTPSATAASVTDTTAAPVAAAPRSSSPALSASGRTLAFVSSSSTVVKGDTNRVADVFVKDLATGKVVRVSVGPSGRQANGPSSDPALTAEGRRVVFTSRASNLVPGDTNGVADVFVRDLVDGRTTRVSLRNKSGDNGGQAGAPSRHGAVSDNGRFVVFESRGRLTGSDTNDETDVFLRDRHTGRTRHLSPPTKVPLELGTATTHGGFDPGISRDGRHVAYGAQVTTGSDQFLVVLRRDRWDGSLDRPCGGGTFFGLCRGPIVLSGDGQAVAYQNSIPAGQYGVVTYFDGRPEWWGFWQDTYEMALSADGETVAFVTDITTPPSTPEPDELPLYVIEAGGGGPVRVADGAHDPTLSADACRLAYTLAGAVRLLERCP